MDVAEFADELYGLPPEEFTAARNERAKVYRSGGDRKLGAQIAALRKPSTAAWVVNQLARHRRAELDQLIELGATMREAHLDLKAERLRTLSDQRHRVIAALAGAGRALAAEQGHAVSETVVQEVEQTLEAALADPDAAQAVGSGHLLTALSYAGLGGGGGAVADPALRRRAGGPGAPSARDREAGEGGDSDVDERRRRHTCDVAAAQAQAADAERQAEEANRQLDQATEQVTLTLRRHDDAQARVQELHDELRVAQEEVAIAAGELRNRQRARVEAARQAEMAAREAARARARVEGMREDQ
ncbi:MAG: hypothetical protein ACXV5Q_17205 [Frankiaceae bacterium]